MGCPSTVCGRVGLAGFAGRFFLRTWSWECHTGPHGHRRADRDGRRVCRCRRDRVAMVSSWWPATGLCSGDRRCGGRFDRPCHPGDCFSGNDWVRAVVGIVRGLDYPGHCLRCRTWVAPEAHAIRDHAIRSEKFTSLGPNHCPTVRPRSSRILARSLAPVCVIVIRRCYRAIGLVSSRSELLGSSDFQVRVATVRESNRAAGVLSDRR